MSREQKMRVVAIHWGWITPGVPDCNRHLQEERYLAFLEGERASGAVFNFTQPGWVLDDALEPKLVALTAENPEPGKQGMPFKAATLAKLRAAVARGSLVYLAYPYSGGVIEGMAGETVLKAYRLTHEVSAKTLGVNATGFFVHDGPTALDWNCPMLPQIGWVAGFRELYGRRTALIVSPDGTILPMFGGNIEGSLCFDIVELLDAPSRVAALRQRFGTDGVTFLGAPQATSMIGLPERRESCWRTITKGWYGGAPLVMQMQAHLRRTDQALAVLSTLQALFSYPVELTAYWKRSLILSDCHLQWLLHDLEKNYLPQARCLEQEVYEHLQEITGGQAAGEPDYWFNPLPFERSAVVAINGVYHFLPTLSPCATVSRAAALSARVQATPTLLRNSRITVELGPQGEILRVTQANGQLLYAGFANRIVRKDNFPVTGNFRFITGRTWSDGVFCGNIRLYTEVETPEEGEYEFAFEVPRGMAIAVRVADDDWVCATNPHWGGGLPSQNRDREYAGKGRIKLARGRQRLCLYAVADEGFCLERATLRRGNWQVELTQWEGELVTAWQEDPFIVERVTAQEEGARAWVCFTGRFRSCQAELTLSLDEGNERIDVRFTRHYPKRVHEGFLTLPLPLSVGSYLGSYCERPYLPAFALETEVAYGETRYYSDKPYGYAEALDTGDAWPTGAFRDLYAGLSPFLGIDTAVAEAGQRSVIVLTDGHNHFYRRRDRQAKREWLGLSLGSSTLHPQTQLYKMPAGSPWEKIGRHFHSDYEDAYDHCEFIAPLGEITCAWSLFFCSQRHLLSWEFAHRQRLERLFPPLPSWVPLDGGVKLQAEEGVILSAIERDKEVVLVRLVNLAAGERGFSLKLPWRLWQVQVTGSMPLKNLTFAESTISGILPPYALREFRTELI